MEKKEQKSRVYICSDPHYNHKNIVRGVSTWDDKSGCRDFDTLEEHNQALIDGINSTVGEDDILYCLGDWSFGGIDSIWEFRKQVKCRDIRFIFGNHDHHIERNKDLVIPEEDHQLDLDIIHKAYEITGETYYYFYTPEEPDRAWSSLYRPEKGEIVIRAQDLFTSCKYYDEVKHYGHRYILFHFAIDVWNKRHHGRMHLYGHSHDSLPDRGDRRMDVGFDAAKRVLGTWRPFEITECQSILQKKSNKPLDHHNENTN